MTVAWAGDFSYDYYVRLLEAAQQKYALRRFADGLAENPSRPQLFLRHDVDVSLQRALLMAQIEAEHGVRTTYMVMPHSTLYDIRRDAQLLRQFLALGHEVALHFDVHGLQRADHTDIADLLVDIEQDCQIISELTGEPVRSVSFHRPLPQFIGGELCVGGLTNAYAAALMGAYIADSKGVWRSGEPLPYLQSAAAPVLQLLVHPIWWGAQHMSAAQRLQQFYNEATSGLDDTGRASFDADLAATIPAVRRSNYPEA